MTEQPWALITGASAGLGAEFARQLAAGSRNLLLVARRVEPMQALGKELRDKYGIRVETLAADLSDPAAPAAIFESCASLGINVDYLINNAGSNGPDLLNDRDWPAQRAYQELMINSVAAMCHLFIPPMIERGFGRVINVASVAGLISAAGDYSYGPTKAYLVALSRGLAATLGGTGVHVCALCPGFTHTDFHASPALTKMKEGMPGWLWYDADVVIRDGLNAVEKGKRVCISGRLYRFLVPVLRSPLGQLVLNSTGVRKPK